MLYLDSSAIVKTVQREPETAALLAHLRATSTVPRFASALVVTEVLRAVARHVERDGLDAAAASARRDAAHARVNSLHLVAITRELLDAAAALGPAGLRTLDAVHLATALRFRVEVTAFVTYDRRLAEAAAAAGLPVASPGQG